MKRIMKIPIRTGFRALIPEFMVGLGFILWIILIFINNMPVWGDEYFTFKVSSVPMNEAINAVINDAHPPLYWIITNFFLSGIGDDIVILRILSAAFGALAIFIISLLFMEISSKHNALKSPKLPFLIFAITSPFAILFFSMARYYSFFAFLAALSIFLKSRTRMTSWLIAGIILVDALMLYTNFLSAFLIIPGWIYLYVKEGQRISKLRLVMVVLLPLAAFSPLAVVLLRTITKLGSQSYFSADFGAGIKGILIRILYSWHVFISGEFIYPWQLSGLVMLGLTLYLLYRFIRFADTESRKMLLINFTLPFAAIIILSVSIFSLGIEFLPSRIAFIQPFVLLAIMLGWITISNTRLRIAIFTLLLLGNIHADYKLVMKENFLHSTYVIPWHQILKDIQRQADFKTDIILYDDEAFDYELVKYDYLPQAYNISDLSFKIDSLVSLNPEKRIWLIFSRRDRTPDQKLEHIFSRLEQLKYTQVENRKYVKEDSKSIAIKEKILGRKVEEYKKELILFKPESSS
jgi:uncharacterized membrane protein